MSFSITAGGNKADTLEALKRSTGYGDASHHDAVRDAAVKIVESAPEGKTFAISASGHHDYSNSLAGSSKGNVTFSVQVF